MIVFLICSVVALGIDLLGLAWVSGIESRDVTTKEFLLCMGILGSSIVIFWFGFGYFFLRG